MVLENNYLQILLLQVGPKLLDYLWPGHLQRIHEKTTTTKITNLLPLLSANDFSQLRRDVERHLKPSELLLSLLSHNY